MGAFHPKKNRHGFTLVELLVVITIIGILMSLTLPAINAIRETARQLQCQNHLKQQAAAIAMHVTESNDRFPCGGQGHPHIGDTMRGNAVNPDNDGDGNNQRGGWTYNILDYLELGNLRGPKFDPNRNPDEVLRESMTTRCTTPVPLFYCPTRRAPANYKTYNRDVISDHLSQSCGELNAKTDYAANCGASTYVECGRATQDANGGVIFQNSMIRVKDITDGTSQTLLVGEKSVDPVGYLENQQRGDDDDCYLGGQNMDSLRCYGNGKIEMDRHGYNPCQNFGAPHLNGVNFIFCDGHLARLNFNITSETLRRLTCRNDGLPVSEYAR